MALPLRVALASSWQVIDAVVLHGTTTLHKTHGTELEVHYRWHPWYALRVIAKRSSTRHGVACLYATREQERILPLLEIPSWMFDRATCAVMCLSTHPFVSITHLLALKELLTCAARASGEGVIENQHLDSSRKGDADEKRENIQPHATQPVSAARANAGMAAPPSGSATESLAPSASTVSPSSLRSPLLPEKGGVR